MILVGRFLGFVRPLIPFIAGASRMSLRRFLPYDVLASGLWAITFCTLGFVFWRSIDKLTTYVSRGLFAFGTLVVVIAAIVALVHLRRNADARAKVREFLDARQDQRLWRIVARVAKPSWRLVLNPIAARLTPGNLGLELTTLFALFIVATFSFFGLGELVGNRGEPHIDRWAADIAEKLRMDVLVNVAKVVTDLGSSYVTAVLTLVAAIFAARRKRAIEAAALVIGWLLVWAAVHISKAAYDRPRPPGSLVDTTNAAFPSGHAAYSIALIAAAARARARGRRLGDADRRRHRRHDPRRGDRRHPRLPRRALPHRRARRHRARRRGLVARRRGLIVHRARSPQCAPMTDDQKTYVIAAAAAAISLIAWLALVVVPAWKSYWRLRDRLVATVLSLYILAAFVLAGAGVGAAALWYFSDRL